MDNVHEPGTFYTCNIVQRNLSAPARIDYKFPIIFFAVHTATYMAEKAAFLRKIRTCKSHASLLINNKKCFKTKFGGPYKMGTNKTYRKPKKK